MSSRRGEWDCAGNQLSLGPYLVTGWRQSDAVPRSRGVEVPPSRPGRTTLLRTVKTALREKKVNINSITSMEEHGCKSFSEIGRCPNKQITLRDGEFRLAPPPPTTPPAELLPEADLSWRPSLAFSLYAASLPFPPPPLLSTYHPLATTSSLVIFLYEPLPRFKKELLDAFY